MSITTAERGIFRMKLGECRRRVQSSVVITFCYFVTLTLQTVLSRICDLRDPRPPPSPQLALVSQLRRTEFLPPPVVLFQVSRHLPVTRLCTYSKCDWADRSAFPVAVSCRESRSHATFSRRHLSTWQSLALVSIAAELLLHQIIHNIRNGCEH